MRDRKKRNIIIGSLCCLLVFMGIGYAILSQTLNISGIANMRGNWNVKITNMELLSENKTGRAEEVSHSFTDTTATFTADLYMPGDSITYNITVKNNGNIDAALKELVPSVENGVQQVKFSNNAVQGKVLRQSESYTFQVSVVFDEDATEIPPDSKTNPPKYTISLTFVQYTGNSLYTPTNETTDNSCFIIDTAGEITGYDYNCGTVVTVPAEIDGIKVKSIAKYTFSLSKTDSFNVWTYSKEESADVTKTYYIFKDQNARSLFLEMQGITQEELDSYAESENIYNYLKGDSTLDGVDLGTLVGEMFIYKNSDGKIISDNRGSVPIAESVPITELDLSHAKYLESIDLDAAPNLKRLNLNTANALTFKSVASYGYGPINYSWEELTVGELEELIINADIFNNIKKIQGSYNTTTAIFKNTHIKKLIILDGKVSHKLDISTNDSGLLDSNSAGIENVIIDDGITKLGTKSLYGLGIKNITLPNIITAIESYALGYNRLVNFTIPASVETIGDSAFFGNPLTTITFEPNSKLKTIGDSAFDWNDLTSVTIPASVETIGNKAFYKNPLTTISFEPNSKLKTIGGSAFEYNKLTSLTIPASVETIGNNAFYHNQLTTINFESNSKLKTIGSGAFNSNKLTNFTIPASVEVIDSSAFFDNKLTNLTIPASVEVIGGGAFSNNQLTTINFESNSKLKTIGDNAFYFSKLTNLTIPASVEVIGNSAFIASQLATITFEPNSKLKTIGNQAFETTKLTSLTIPASVETIGKNAFYKNQLATITFEPNSKLKAIGYQAFYYNQLTNLTIPASVETIEGYAFSNNYIKTITFEPNSKLKKIDNYAFNKNSLTNAGLGKLPSSLTELATYAFEANTRLTQITLTSPTDIEGWPNGGKVDGKTVVYER